MHLGKCDEVFKASSNKMMLLLSWKSWRFCHFYQLSPWIGPWSLHDLVCHVQSVFIPFFLPQHDLVENSARQQDAQAKNIPNTATDHPKYITPGIMLPSAPATGAVSARQCIWWCGNIWSLCLLLPSVVFNSNEQHIKNHMLTRLPCSNTHDQGLISCRSLSSNVLFHITIFQMPNV